MKKIITGWIGRQEDFNQYIKEVKEIFYKNKVEARSANRYCPDSVWSPREVKITVEEV